MADPSLTSAPVESNQDRGPALMAIFWTECAIALVVVSLRCHARILIRKIGKDDWIMFAAAPLFVAACIVTTVQALHGGARHLRYLTPTQVRTTVQLNWAAQPFAILVVALGKISTAFLILRIENRILWRRWFLHGSIGLTVFATIGAILVLFCQCNPPRALWDEVPGAKCWNASVNSNIQILNASWNAFFDLMLSLMPITIVWNLNMKLRKKVALCTVLGLGVFACISAVIKASKLKGLNARSDLTWATYDLYIWGCAEMFVIIVLGSVPTLKPIYDRIILIQTSHNASSSLSHRRSAYPSSKRFAKGGDAASRKLPSPFYYYGNAARTSPSFKHVEGANDEIGLRDIRVRNDFEVLRGQSEDDGKGAVVVGQNVV